MHDCVNIFLICKNSPVGVLNDARPQHNRTSTRTDGLHKITCSKSFCVFCMGYITYASPLVVERSCDQYSATLVFTHHYDSNKTFFRLT